jgi:hypothetical protein
MVDNDVIYQTKRHHIPDDSNVHSQHCGNCKSPTVRSITHLNANNSEDAIAISCLHRTEAVVTCAFILYLLYYTKFNVEQAIKAQREALGGGGRLASRPGRFIPGNDPIPIVREAGCASGPVWTGAENLAYTRIRTLERPARSKSRLTLHCVSFNINSTVQALRRADASRKTPINFQRTGLRNREKEGFVGRCGP